MEYGVYKYGESVYKYGEYNADLNATLAGLLSRFPTGRAWNGKNIIALERAFAEEFNDLKQRIKYIASKEGVIWGESGESSQSWEKIFEIEVPDLNNKRERMFAVESYLALQYKESPFNLYSIEKKLHLNGFKKARIFYFTGLRKVTQLPPSTMTCFGCQSRFGAGWHANQKADTHNSQFGEHFFEETNPKNFKHGASFNFGRIDYCCTGNENNDKKIWNSTISISKSDRKILRLFFFVGGSQESADGSSEDFLEPIYLTENEYERFRKVLLSVIPFGMFAIINYSILKK